jgi:hypothetical protein
LVFNFSRFFCSGFLLFFNFRRFFVRDFCVRDFFVRGSVISPIYQHFPFQGTPKFTQIGILGMKINHLATLVGLSFTDEKVCLPGIGSSRVPVREAFQ